MLLLALKETLGWCLEKINPKWPISSKTTWSILGFCIVTSCTTAHKWSTNLSKGS